MTNEEKKQFIFDTQDLLMKYWPYDKKNSSEENKRRKGALWQEFSLRFLDLLPKTLFKYRRGTEDDFIAFENDQAWFSYPKDFDDDTDTTINNDIETEIAEYKKDPSSFIKKLSLAFVRLFAKQFQIDVNSGEDLIDEAIPLFNDDGTFNEEKTRDFLTILLPNQPIDDLMLFLKRIVTSLLTSNNGVKALEPILSKYVEINRTLRNSVFAFSLAEEGDNKAMWSSFGNENSGFCIEYEFPKDTIIGQEILLHLLPIYYGEKPIVYFHDVVCKELLSADKRNGVDYETYQQWFLSACTKDKTYEFQKEWRITFNKDTINSNLQPFPFIKSVILGERINDINRDRIIKSAKKKNINVYQRQLNKTGSAIKIVKIL